MLTAAILLFLYRKRKHLVAFGIFLLILLPARGQEHDSGFACSYYGEAINPEITTHAASDVAIRIIEEVVGVVGLRANFEIREANVPNAAAVIVDNKRYILYNSKFMALINRASGTNWAGISILAHEIGHHLNGHTLDQSGSRPEIELEADEFSGFVLSKLGASLDDAQAAISVAASQAGSHTHPGKRDRLRAITTGWQNASRQTQRNSGMTQKTNSEIERPAIVRSEPEPETAIAERYIAYDVHFEADPSHDYFITIRGNLVAVDDGSLYLIGRLAESNRRGYKLMISDKDYNYLYISGDGILNGSGKKVGWLKQH